MQKVMIDWEMVKHSNIDNSEHNNLKENKTRIQHKYKVKDLVLNVKKSYERCMNAKIISSSTELEGPYAIFQIHKNGNDKIQRGKYYTDVESMRRITPYTKWYTQNSDRWWVPMLFETKITKIMGEYQH